MDKQNRIKKNYEFGNLYRKSKRFYTKDFKLLVSNSRQKYPRFGFTITKKYGKANKRNKIKRRLKEIIRLNLDKFENKNYIFVPSLNTIDMSSKQLEISLFEILDISKKGKK